MGIRRRAVTDFRVMFESVPNLYLVLDPDFNILAASKPYKDIPNKDDLRQLIKSETVKSIPIVSGHGQLQYIIHRNARNEEADVFSRSVTHDLRNPVNAIIGFSSYLLNRSTLGDTEKDYLNEIHDSAKKMERLINDLLILSQASHREIKHESVNLSEIVKSIARSLQKQYPERQVDWQIEDDLSVSGDSHLMQIALENLINNAWKYTSKTELAKIEFSALDDRTYFIRDNGVGFPENKSDLLFTPFTRLHAESDFPGTGIGLTTVKRIIDRHSGHVWAESNPQAGTTFYMRLS